MGSRGCADNMCGLAGMGVSMDMDMDDKPTDKLGMDPIPTRSRHRGQGWLHGNQRESGEHQLKPSYGLSIFSHVFFFLFVLFISNKSKSMTFILFIHVHIHMVCTGNNRKNE